MTPLEISILIGKTCEGCEHNNDYGKHDCRGCEKLLNALERKMSKRGKGRRQPAESPVGPPPAVRPAHSPHVFKPGSVRELDSEEEIEDLSLRDYFAMAALNGLVSRRDCYLNNVNELAKHIYDLADAMMERRKS